MMESIQAEVINLVVLVLTALVGYVAKQATSFLKKKGALVELENNKVVVGIVVNAVEQLYKEVGGPEKLHMAKLQLTEILQEKGVKISPTQIDALIENAVKEMNDNIQLVKEVK